MKKNVLTLLMLLNAGVSLLACCAAEPHSLTELLLCDRYKRSIFQCRIYRSAADMQGAFFSEAEVLEVYKGKLDSAFVIINTGGNTTAGGRRLKPFSTWLIFSTAGENGEFGATVCDWFSCGSEEDPEKYYNTLQIVSTYKMITEKALSESVVWYYPDGAKAAEGSFLNGKPEGRWLHYRPDGTLKSEMHFKNGLLHGKYTVIRDQRQGKEVTTYKTGVAVLTETYYGESPFGLRSVTKVGDQKNGFEETSVKTWHPNGAPALEYKTLDAVEYGLQYHYSTYVGHYLQKDSLGKVLNEGDYFLGAKTGRWVETEYRSGMSTVKEYPKPELPAFDFYRFHANGRPYMTGNLRNGRPDGLWRYVSMEGNVVLEINYSEGVYDGELRHFGQNGKVYELDVYRKGRLDGERLTFFEDGAVQSRSFYENGVKSGAETVFRKPGEWQSKASYKNGRLDGEYIGLDRNGDTTLVATFRRGALDGEAVEYNRDLRFCSKSTGKYQDGLKTGEWITCDCTGKRLRRCVFDDKSSYNTYGSMIGGKCEQFK